MNFISKILLLLLSVNNLTIKDNNINSELPKVEIITKFNDENIVYRGMSNPIFIKVENNIKYAASGEGLKKVDTLGNYKLYPRSGREVIITVKGQRENGSFFEVSKTFKIKDFATGVSQFNGESCKKCDLRLSKKELINGKLSYDFPDLLIKGLSAEIKSFSIKLPGKTTRKVYGNKIKSSQLLKDIKKLKTGSQVQIFNINIKLSSSFSSRLRICKIAPITIKIIR